MANRTLSHTILMLLIVIALAGHAFVEEHEFSKAVKSSNTKLSVQHPANEELSAFRLPRIPVVSDLYQTAHITLLLPSKIGLEYSWYNSNHHCHLDPP
jgi:hypothetical protein